MTLPESIKTAITDFAASPFAIEWLKFDDDTRCRNSSNDAARGVRREDLKAALARKVTLNRSSAIADLRLYRRRRARCRTDGVQGLVSRSL